MTDLKFKLDKTKRIKHHKKKLVYLDNKQKRLNIIRRNLFL